MAASRKRPLATQHFVGRLQHALEVGRIALGQRELNRQFLEANAPGEASFGAGDLEQAIEPSCDR